MQGQTTNKNLAKGGASYHGPVSMGLVRGAVFHNGGVPENSPLASMGHFPSLMGRFPTFMGHFPECLNGPFPSGNPLENSPSMRKASETGRIRFRGVRFQTPNSVSFLGLTEFRGAGSVSSSQPIICVPMRAHQVFRRTHRVCRKTQ